MIEGVAAGAKDVVLQVIVVAITYFARVISVARSGVKEVCFVNVWLCVCTSGLSKHFRPWKRAFGRRASSLEGIEQSHVARLFCCQITRMSGTFR